MRDTILPPIIKKQLRGRPKKLRRREGFEESVSNGKCVRMSYKGRIMHRGYCKSVEHMINKCPTKPKGYAPPKTGNKRGRTKKKYVDDEVMVEEELQSKEAATGETELMDDLLNQMENEDDIQEQEILNFDDDIEVFKVVQPKMVSKAAMEFVNLHWSFYLFSSDWNVLIFSNRYHNIKLEAWPLRLRNSGGEDIMHTLDKKRKRDNPWERVPATRVLYPCKFSRFACNNSLDGETKATIVEASRSVVALISYSGSVQLSQGCGTIIERHDATIIVLTSANLLRRHTSKDFGRNKLAKNITVHSHLCGGYFYKDGESTTFSAYSTLEVMPEKSTTFSAYSPVKIM
ncbi:uncharacterized protein LOC141717463 isoform X2 [Apium graveolens]|uniref:uncharacterized protein LOC141717463 isoform X2 n=1 Tax=Apium graveolens TaxID=4045 RepID=UPI003D7C1257